MKTSLFILPALLFFSGFTNHEFAQNNSREQETAQKEIKKVVKDIFLSLEKMDVEALFRSYSDTPGFVLFTTNGSMVDFPKAKADHAEWFKSLSSLKITTLKVEFKFLPGSTVICSWLGKFMMMLKKGQRLKIDKFGVTFIFRKIDNQWKVIYQHSSSLPPVQA